MSKLHCQLHMWFVLIILCLFSTSAWAWTAESGSGVVSENQTIVRTSLEATTVLKSDALSQLQGETDLGGAVNYASFATGGVMSTRNVVSSRDVVLLGNDDYLAWLRTNGLATERLGISADDTFTIPNGAIGQNASFTNLVVTSNFRVSGDADFVRVSSTNLRILSGGILSSSSDTALSNVSATNMRVVTSFKTSGETQLLNVTADQAIIINSINNQGAMNVSGQTTLLGNTKLGSGGNETWINTSGIITYLGTARPRRTIVLTGAGATPNLAAQSADANGLGGSSSLFRQTRLVYDPNRLEDAYWTFELPDDWSGSSVNTQIVWYNKSLETTTVVSFSTSMVCMGDSVSYDNTSYGFPGTVTDTGNTSSQNMITAQFTTTFDTNCVSGNQAWVRLQRDALNSSDTITHDVNVLALRMEYQSQTESA